MSEIIKILKQLKDISWYCERCEHVQNNSEQGCICELSKEHSYLGLGNTIHRELRLELNNWVENIRTAKKTICSQIECSEKERRRIRSTIQWDLAMKIEKKGIIKYDSEIREYITDFERFIELFCELK